MKRFISSSLAVRIAIAVAAVIALAYIVTHAAVPVGTGLSSPVMTNFNARYFTITLASGTTPTNVIQLNLPMGPGSPDLPGDIINIVNGTNLWTNDAGILHPKDLTLPLMITNQLQFGPGTTNIIYRSGDMIVISNQTPHLKLEGLGGSFEFSWDLNTANISASGGANTVVGGPLESQTHFPGASSIYDLGLNNNIGWWRSLWQRGTNFNNAIPWNLTNYYRAADYMDGGTKVFDIQSWTNGAAGPVVGFSFRTNGVEVFNVTGTGGPSSGANWVASGTTNSTLAGTARADNGWLTNGVSYGRTYNVGSYGILPDASDHTIALSNLIQTVYTAGGGTIVFNGGDYIFTNQIVLPNDGGTPQKQPPLRFTGQGAYECGEAIAGGPTGGTILHLRFIGSPAKIDTRGLGSLQIDNLTLYSDGTSGTPFLFDTFTTLKIHNTTFWGKNIGVSADEDALILGGTTTTLDGTTNAPFQGYGTVIADNFFQRIRRAVYGRTYFNGVQIRDNIIWNECGGDAAIVSSGDVAQSNQGLYVSGNLIAEPYYTSAFALTNTYNATFVGNNLYDPGVGTVDHYHFDSTADFNTIVTGWQSPAKLLFNTLRENMFFDSGQSRTNYMTSIRGTLLNVRNAGWGNMLATDVATGHTGVGEPADFTEMLSVRGNIKASGSVNAGSYDTPLLSLGDVNTNIVVDFSTLGWRTGTLTNDTWFSVQNMPASVMRQISYRLYTGTTNWNIIWQTGLSNSMGAPLPSVFPSNNVINVTFQSFGTSVTNVDVYTSWRTP